MEIEIKKPLTSNKVSIHPGRYLVGIQKDTQQLTLAGGGKTLAVAAKKRPAKKPVRYHEASLSPGMGKEAWVLLVKSPPKTEYVAFLYLDENAKKKVKLIT
jgi:hypothetical protein